MKKVRYNLVIRKAKEIDDILDGLTFIEAFKVLAMVAMSVVDDAATRYCKVKDIEVTDARNELLDLYHKEILKLCLLFDNIDENEKDS